MTDIHEEISRRDFVAKVAAATLAIAAPLAGEQKDQEQKEPEVTATEDLMREHGVLRRALLVYQETIPKLRQKAVTIDPRALHQAADLFRTFGEDYHEKMLEEEHIFPVVRKMKGERKSVV